MKPNTIRYLVASAVGLALAFVIMLTQGLFSQTEQSVIMRILSDAFFVSGVVLSCVGAILFATNNGFFDILVFGVGMLFTALKSNVKDRKYKDFYEYRKAKAEKKRSCAYLLIVGLALIAIGGLFLIWYYPAV